MRAFYCDRFLLPLPPGHRFPIAKYELLRRRVEASPLAIELEEPPPATDAELELVHDPGYVARMREGRLGERAERRLGFPWSPELVERSRRSVGGTVAAARSALAEGSAVNLAGGTHHAFADRGEGFCVWNDAAVAARVLQAEGRVRRVAILDCDVHQGDGTAAIFADDPTVFTFSIHGRDNYPLVKEASDLDVALEAGAGDAAYLAALDAALKRVFAAGPFDLALFLAGADPYVGDRYGRLALSAVGLAARDRRVLAAAAAHGVPVAVAMAGGYARDPEVIAGLHFQTVAAAASVGAVGAAAPPGASAGVAWPPRP